MRGMVIGAYSLLEQIGEGGMGTVWLAEHTLLGRRAAIKLLLPVFSTDGGIVERFINEARAVAAISDPGIVQVFDFGVHTDGSPYIVMEVLEGETLEARLGRVGRLLPDEAVRLVQHVAHALAAAHDRGVIHRDIKPENLFVIADPAVPGGERPKVLDFGVAKLSRAESLHKTRTGSMLGTPMYMSPEQCRGAGQVDHRTDIYSLGAVLFSLVVGHPPFRGEGAGDIIIAHVRDQPPIPSSLAPGIPLALDQVILRCLEKDPARRYQTMQELAAALAALDAGASLLASGPRASASYPGGASTSFSSSGLHAPSLAGLTTMSSANGEASGGRSRRRTAGLALGLATAVGAVIGGVIALRGDAVPAESEPVPAVAPAPPVAPVDAAIAVAADAAIAVAADAAIEAMNPVSTDAGADVSAPADASLPVQPVRPARSNKEKSRHGATQKSGGVRIERVDRSD